MGEIGEWWQTTQSSTRSQFKRDEIDFENLIYILFNERIWYFFWIGFNSLKQALNNFSHLIII